MLTYKTENKPIDHANVSYIGTTNLNCSKLTPFIEEIRDAGTATEPAASLPPRNFSSSGSPCYTVPLYVGYDPPAVPPPP